MVIPEHMSRGGSALVPLVSKSVHLKSILPNSFLTKTYVVGTQQNYLNDKVLLSNQKAFNLWTRI